MTTIAYVAEAAVHPATSEPDAARFIATQAGFLAWVGLSAIWAPPRMGGIQNALVYILFGAMVLFSGTLTARNETMDFYPPW